MSNLLGTASNPEKNEKLLDVVQVLQFKDVSPKANAAKDPPIPLSERAFLQWEDINFFVPTESDPM